MNEKQELERELAYDAARSDITSFCGPRNGGEAPGLWWDTTTPNDDDAEYVDKAVRYLGLCGLLKHHPNNPAVVQILNAT